MKKVIVVGGGFTGLVTAYYLGRAGFQVDLHEATSRLGGLISTHKMKEGLVETAANGMIWTDEVEEFFQELQLEYLKPLAQYEKRRFIFRGGLRRWPLSIVETFLAAVKVLPRVFFDRSSLSPLTNETIEQWGHRVLGSAPTKYLLAPGLQGIYAGDPKKLSAELILGSIFKNKKSKYKGTVAPQEGMGQLIETLHQKIVAQGAQVFLDSNYHVKSKNEPQVVCVSADQLKNTLPGLLDEMETIPLLSVTLFFENPKEKIEGFGCLIPENSGFKTLGVLSNTCIFENRGPCYSETWILREVEISDQIILQRISEERKNLLGSDDEPVNHKISRWPSAIPHYTVELKDLLKTISLPENIYLNGNYLSGLGLSKILSRTKNLVAQIQREHA
jgi:oxygen-dependent protoporphyrinogen oxidase